MILDTPVYFTLNATKFTPEASPETQDWYLVVCIDDIFYLLYQVQYSTTTGSIEDRVS
jgi:hypothetical protein